jgi:hypothetical protein
MDDGRGTLESEATSFLLLVAGLFFSVEGVLHYVDFFVTSNAKNSVSIVLTLGSAAIALLYFALAYSCWRNPRDTGFFAFALILSSILSASYFILVIVESLGSKFYFSASVSYFEFLSGYGSVTIFVELLIAFFSFRVYRTLSK